VVRYAQLIVTHPQANLISTAAAAQLPTRRRSFASFLGCSLFFFFPPPKELAR